MPAEFASSFPLRDSRVHEACGPGAPGFAAICAARRPGEVLWVVEDWQPESLNPVALSLFFDPARLLLARCRDQTEGLAVAEEAMRDGALALVVIVLSQPLTLTTGRRLQLAAKAGATTGLCLIPEGMGSNAAETRWHCAPIFDAEVPPDSTLQCWKLIKNKSGTLGAWHVRWDTAARRLHVVSPVAQRPGSQDVSG